MAENWQQSTILKDMLSQVPAGFDKREGSILFNTLSPVAYSLAMQNYMLGYLFDLLFADTAAGEWLDRVVSDFGVDREQATYSLRQVNTYGEGGAPVDVPLFTRFGVGGLTFRLTERIATGQYKAVCQQVGTQGNAFEGDIIPVDNINGLGYAQLIAEPLIPARDAESDEQLRERFYNYVRQAPFGGNIADYEQKTMSIQGVGAVHVFNASVMGAGQVGIIIGDDLGNKASPELINQVQNLMGTNGNGIAPIGHTVTVSTSVDLPINVAAQIKIKIGGSFAIVKPIVEQVIVDYIETVGFNDPTVFYAKLVANILNAHESIVDVGSVTMNGQVENISLNKTFDNYQVPVVGTVVVTEVV